MREQALISILGLFLIVFLICLIFKTIEYNMLDKRYDSLLSGFKRQKNQIKNLTDQEKLLKGRNKTLEDEKYELTIRKYKLETNMNMNEEYIQELEYRFFETHAKCIDLENMLESEK